MGLSSASYLGVAVTWHLYGFVRLGRLFWLIAGLSISADAGADLLPSTIIGRARIADRLCGTTGLVLSVAFNCTSPSATAWVRLLPSACPESINVAACELFTEKSALDSADDPTFPIISVGVMRIR